MRKKTSLSKLVLAAMVAAMFTTSSFAQSGAPPQRADGKGFKAPPRYLPPAASSNAGPIRKVGFQESDVAVPSILSGKSATPAPPMMPPTQSPAATSKEPGSQEVRMPAIPGNRPTSQSSTSIPQRPSQFQEMAPMRSTASPSQAPMQQAAPIPRMTANTVNTLTDQSSPMQAADGQVQQASAAESPNWLRTRQIDSVETDDKPLNPVTQSSLPPAMPSTTNPLITSEATTEAINPTSLIATDGPKLRVTSTGPSSISIGKTARFEVLVENLESRSADSVIIGIDLPEWAEITSAMPSTGSNEMTDGTEESRMVWQIPIVEAATTEKIVIEVIPREPRPFDIDVEWTFKPIRGKTTVEVTQPQLSIQIAGPTEVQFGEKALYHVTVSNPGTGTAENVSVMLPEALGGERASLESIAPQQQKKFQVELIARSAGTLDLTTTVLADGDLKESDTRAIVVRRAVLDVQLQGPPMKYAGSTAKYQIVVSNQGDAMAKDVVAAIALPPGVEFVSGIDNVEKIDGGIRWNVGMLSPGNQRAYQMTCNMMVAGDINVEAASRGAGDLAATNSFVTRVEAVADLVLAVADPKGPLPTGESIDYEIRIKNRGTKSARGINIVMHFSEGVEPIDAEGIAHELATGQVTFAPIAQIDPGQEIVLTVKANAHKAGSHRFRAQLLCEESDSHEVAEGTTRFFGESSASTAERTPETESGGEFKR